MKKVKGLLLVVDYFDSKPQSFVCANLGNDKYLDVSDGFIVAILLDTGEQLSIPEIAIKNIKTKLVDVEIEEKEQIEEKGDVNDVE